MKQLYLWHFWTSMCLIWHCNSLLKAFFFLYIFLSTSYIITKYAVLSLHSTKVCLVLQYLERRMMKCNLIWRRVPIDALDECNHNATEYVPCELWHQ